MKHPDFNINDVIDYLQGSCESLYNMIEGMYDGMSFDDLTMEDHAAIDNEIFNCDECGWWCEIYEMSDTEEQVCRDCRPNDDD